MDITPAFTVIVTVVGVGAALGAGLASAAQIFAVEENPKVSAIEEILPGINCGACGYPGCAAYAEAVAENSEVSANLCIPGGEKTSQKIGEITGKSAAPAVKKVALLKCVKDSAKAAKSKYIYEGIEDCAAAVSILQGSSNCSFSCVSLGNCARICPVNAISMKNGRPEVDGEKCTGCGLCVKTCPRKVLELGLYPGRVEVCCNNASIPKIKRPICPSACIGCTLCMKRCPYGAIVMDKNLAVVSHEKCPIDCPAPCVEKCPTTSILKRFL